MPYYKEQRKRRKKSKLEAKYHQMLRERDNRIHELEQRVAEHPLRVEIAELKGANSALDAENQVLAEQLRDHRRREAKQLLHRLSELAPSIAVVGHTNRPRAIIDELLMFVGART
jgi:hypothetical protein